MGHLAKTHGDPLVLHDKRCQVSRAILSGGVHFTRAVFVELRAGVTPKTSSEAVKGRSFGGSVLYTEIFEIASLRSRVSGESAQLSLQQTACSDEETDRNRGL